MSPHNSDESLSNNIVTTPVIHEHVTPGAPAQTIKVTCIALPEGLVFVDCGVNLKKVAKFRADMERKFSRKTTHLLLTHSHWDHTFAMSIFRDVDIVIAESGLKDMLKWKELSEMPPIWKKQLIQRYYFDTEIVESIQKYKFIKPHVLVKDEFRIGTNDENVVFKVIGGHSPDSSYIYNPKDQVLCAGDNLLEYYPPVTADLQKAVEIYYLWESMKIKKVVPGHGRIVEKQYIKYLRVYCERMMQFLRKSKKSDLTIEEVINHKERPPYFGEQQSSWVKGGEYHTIWLNDLIESWYKRI